MSYKLPPGIKPYIDALGSHYKNVDPKLLQGDQQVLLDVAFTSAKQKFFQAGHGFAKLNFDNVEIRVWPGRSNIAFCFGIHVGVSNISHYVYMAHMKDRDGKPDPEALQRWLKHIGFFATVH